ncbi:putative transcriptional regulatory protein C139.03-like protein 13 [Colletotrichum chlorophyti]|uniref:Putative transcriptional regulatory protein C139.03-like protein 13 n=1 Tax=Colletotrichum chlorophyti TaxID=708187 RepID=A0A1Q8R9L6_9PEZI|nr:putative transcriptional regulatory protein C139.03-like protein 13 [Colletotrichum chlorophyti]
MENLPAAVPSGAQKKRRRPALSCEQCRRRKIRCDRNLPCGTCVRSKHALCTYTSQTKAVQDRSPEHGAPATAGFISSDLASQLHLPEPILPASQPLANTSHSAFSTGRTNADVFSRRCALVLDAGSKSSVTNPSTATLGFPEPIMATSQPVVAPGQRAPSTGTGTDNDVTSPFPLTTPASSGEHSGPADFGMWQPLKPRPAAAASVHADSVSTPGSCPGSSSTVNSLIERVKQLEQQLSDLQIKNDRDGTAPTTECSSSRREGLKYTRGCVSKTRFFGQSHWMNAADTFYRLVTFARKLETEKSTQLYTRLEKCKQLARVIKTRRTPAFNTVSTGKSMPSREVADALLGCYLRTFESVQRIVHIPTLKADYERYWQHPADASEPSIILLQLCMGIGATFYDERFTLRTLATQWFWEAMLWLITPCEKSRMTIIGLQIRCLMHHLRQTANIGCDLAWIGAGALIRTAMYMGLHRDPKSLIKMSPYRAEMRRRLWATILEISLQSSIDSGGPPLVSPWDYDTEPPANLEDDQLVEDTDSAFPVLKDTKTYTHMTVCLALFETFATRLAVTKRVNEFRSDTVYEETLRYSKELGASLNRMMQRLKAHPEVTSFQLRYVQFMSYRLFFALHHQIVPLSLRNPVYYFSRKICVDTALRLCEAAFLTPDKSGTGAMEQPSTPSEVDFQRLTVNGAGSYRSIPLQVVMTIELELINLKEEEMSNGPSIAGSESQLRAILGAVHEWSRARIRSGETNIKGHTLSVLLGAHILSLETGISDDKISEHFQKACEERVEECYNMLLEMAGDDVPEEGIQAPVIHDLDMDFDVGVDLLVDWDWDSVDNNGYISNMNLGNIDMMFA